MFHTVEHKFIAPKSEYKKCPLDWAEKQHQESIKKVFSRLNSFKDSIAFLALIVFKACNLEP